MNEQTKAALNEWLQHVIAGLEKAGQFAADQLPIVIQEYLAWGFWEAIVTGIVCVGALYGSIAAFRVGVKLLDEDEYAEGGIIITVMSVFAFIVSVTYLYGAVLTAIQITVAPRVYLIEQLRKLL